MPFTTAARTHTRGKERDCGGCLTQLITSSLWAMTTFSSTTGFGTGSNLRNQGSGAARLDTQARVAVQTSICKKPARAAQSRKGCRGLQLVLEPDV